MIQAALDADASTTTGASSDASIASPVLDYEAFRTPLWVIQPPPPPPVPAQKPEPPPPPLKLQLVSIIADASVDAAGSRVYRAALYDPDQDRLFDFAVGDLIGPSRRIVSIESDSILIEDGKHKRRLSLRDPSETAPGGGP